MHVHVRSIYVQYARTEYGKAPWYGVRQSTMVRSTQILKLQTCRNVTINFPYGTGQAVGGKLGGSRQVVGEALQHIYFVSFLQGMVSGVVRFNPRSTCEQTSHQAWLLWQTDEKYPAPPLTQHSWNIDARPWIPGFCRIDTPTPRRWRIIQKVWSNRLTSYRDMKETDQFLKC